VKAGHLAKTALLLAFSGVATAGQPLSVSLSPAANKLGSAESVVWTMTNETNESMYVLRRETPLDGMSGPAFEVERDGEEVQYLGKIVHWDEPSPEDFIELKPHQAISVQIDLGKVYDLSKAGRYHVRYASGLSFIASTNVESGNVDDAGSLELDTAPIEIVTKGRSLLDYAADRDTGIVIGGGAKAAPAYSSCTNGMRNMVLQGHNAARNNNDTLYSVLSNIGSRYTTWFGAYDFARYQKVYDVLYKTTWVLNNATITYDCYCEANMSQAYAYVTATQPYRIHLCGAYWAAPVTGSNSKAGTIFHELTHFTVIGDTRDYVYGQYYSRNLARNNPQLAVWNADNYGYFFENTPYQY
jgi:peptidyl-Lys metalloendopeptidase